MSLTLLRSVATAGGESFYAPAAYSLLAKFHRRTRALAMSIHQGALYSGVMVSGFLGGMIADRWGWRASFYVYGAAGILLGLVFLVRLKDGEESRPASKREPWQNPFKMLGVLYRTPTAVLLTVGFTAIVFVNNAYVVWAPEFVRERFDLSLSQAGGYSMFFHHITALAGVLIGGVVSDAWVRRFPRARLTLQALTMLLGAPAIAFMGIAHTPWAVYLAMAVFGLFRGLYESNTHASLFDVIEPRFRGSAVGMMVMSAFLLGSVSPWLMGVLRSSFVEGEGLGQAFVWFSLAYVVGAVAVGCAFFFSFQKDRIVETDEE